MTVVIEPLYNRVILKQIQTKKIGSIVMAPGGQKSADRAEVLAVGPGLLDKDTGKYIPTGLKKGDVVLINAWIGMRATVDNEEVIIQKDEEILGREVTSEV